MAVFLKVISGICPSSVCRTVLIALAISVLPLTAREGAAQAFKFSTDIGKSIEKSAQDVGKSIEKGAHDVGKSIEKASPETEQSPSDPCKNNSKLPQCDLEKVEK
jgi:hypothetical protein